MLAAMRNSAKGFFSKLILFALVGMFALWGIGDVFRSLGGGPSEVATVGKTHISVQEYKNALKASQGQQMEALSALINNALVHQEENALGVIVGDEEVARAIVQIPAFQDKDGHFSKELYQQKLAMSGRGEAQLVADLRKHIANQLYVGTLMGDAAVPEMMVEAVWRLNAERRAANILYLTPSDVASKVAAPTEAEIKAYYNAHAKEFTAPELRTFSYVALPLSDVEARVEVSEDDIKQAYAEHRDDFRQPDKRVIGDMQFDNEQDAKEAAKQLAAGKSFAQVASTASLSNEGKVNLGPIPRDQLPKEVADQVFGLAENAVSAPLFTDFTWHIYQAGKLEQGRPSSYEEAHDAIARDIKARQAQDTIVRMINGFEDTLAGGATLEQAAEKLGEKVHALGPVTREGMTPDGHKARIPDYANFLNVVFTTPEKDRSQAVQSTDGSYFVVRVDSVLPEHVRPLTEVKDAARKAALAEKTKAQLEKAALDINTQAQNGKKLADAVAAAGFHLSPAGNITRASDAIPEGAYKGKPISKAFSVELFKLKAGQGTHAYPTGGGDYMMGVLTQVTPAPAKPEPKALEAVRTELKNTLTDEAWHDYLNALRAKYPVSVHGDALGIKSEAAANEAAGE